MTQRAARCRALLVLLALIALPLAGVGGARAAGVPDAAMIERLRQATMKANRFRIETGHGEFLVTSLRMDAAGIVVREPQKYPALVSAGRDPSETKRVAWTEVERIAAMRSHGLRSGLVAALVGAVAGGALDAWIQHNYDNVDNFVLLIPFGAAVGFGVGGIVGSATGWRDVYP